LLLLLLLAAADSKRPRASPESCFFAAGEAAALVALGERHRGPDGVRQRRGALCSAPQRQAERRGHRSRARRRALDGAVELVQRGAEAPRDERQSQGRAGGRCSQAREEVGGLEGAGAADATGGDGGWGGQKGFEGGERDER